MRRPENTSSEQIDFPTRFDHILAAVDRVAPENYARTRNFIDGAVTRLSPYISRGVLSTKQVLHRLTARGYKPLEMEKLVQELAWRDYWQLVALHKGLRIEGDLRAEQYPVAHHEMPAAIVGANTGIDAIDSALREFYRTGYMHNHVRMYVASIACNVGRSHWRTPSRWMYYRLLDADWATNTLSWQWVAGTNSSKKYYANQDNINKYCHTNQSNTFLDATYDMLTTMNLPMVLRNTTMPELATTLPATNPPGIDPSLPTLIYNSYNLDPQWHQHEKTNRVLLLEPSHFSRYPVSQGTLDFILDLADNIAGIQIFTGEFSDLLHRQDISTIIFKEHPLFRHYKGKAESRDWMFKEHGYHASFFSFWKECRKELGG